MKFYTFITGILGLSLLVTTSVCHAQVVVYAAASLADVMDELDVMYEKKYATIVKTSYASSSTLAKQIQRGGKADVFISADVAWMKYLIDKKLISQANHVHLLGNRLVLIAPAKNSTIKIEMNKGFDIAKSFKGKLCTGNTSSVPAGKYAKDALIYLAWWDELRPRLVETEDVRAALNFVARGECQLGIVYTTDAASTKKVKTVAMFPKNSHADIIYPMGLIHPQNSDAKRFYQFLQSAEAKSVFKKYGFATF